MANERQALMLPQEEQKRLVARHPSIDAEDLDYAMEANTAAHREELEELYGKLGVKIDGQPS